MYVYPRSRKCIYGSHGPESSILLAGIGVWKVSTEACVFSSIKIDYYDYQKSLFSRINEVYVFQ